MHLLLLPATYSRVAVEPQKKIIRQHQQQEQQQRQVQVTRPAFIKLRVRIEQFRRRKALLEQVRQSRQHQVNKCICDEKAPLDLVSPIEHKKYAKCPYRKLRHHNEQDKWKRQQHILSIPLVVSIKQARYGRCKPGIAVTDYTSVRLT